MQHSTLSQESTLVGSIRNDETQLRILVVVLSLTGGLVLAFFLGFGIFLYWHCVLKTKQIDQEKTLNNKVKPSSGSLSTRSDLSSSIDAEYKPSAEMNQQDSTTAPPMPVIHSFSPPLRPSSPHIGAEPLAEPIFLPSAPTAKELESKHMISGVQYEDQVEHPPGTSSSVAAWQPSLLNHPFRSNQSLCQSVVSASAPPDPPPPAYTPKEY